MNYSFDLIFLQTFKNVKTIPSPWTIKTNCRGWDLAQGLQFAGPDVNDKTVHLHFNRVKLNEETQEACSLPLKQYYQLSPLEFYVVFGNPDYCNKRKDKQDII